MRRLLGQILRQVDNLQRRERAFLRAARGAASSGFVSGTDATWRLRVALRLGNATQRNAAQTPPLPTHLDANAASNTQLLGDPGLLVLRFYLDADLACSPPKGESGERTQARSFVDQPAERQHKKLHNSLLKQHGLASSARAAGPAGKAETGSFVISSTRTPALPPGTGHPRPARPAGA